MPQFLNITEKIKDALLAEDFTNTVTYGDLFEVDLNKKTIFPLAHFNIDNITFNGATNTYNINILFIEIEDVNKEDSNDLMRGHTNLHFLYSEQLHQCNKIVEQAFRGDLWDNQIQLIEGSANAQPFKERFENLLCGWALSFQILVPSNVSIC